jgi:hypothetical protein
MFSKRFQNLVRVKLLNAQKFEDTLQILAKGIGNMVQVLPLFNYYLTRKLGTCWANSIG